MTGKGRRGAIGASAAGSAVDLMEASFFPKSCGCQGSPAATAIRRRAASGASLTAAKLRKSMLPRGRRLGVAAGASGSRRESVAQTAERKLANSRAGAAMPQCGDETMKKSGASQGQSAAELISKRIAELGDWRGETLGRMRRLIKEADPDVVEEWKWMGTPVWSHDGIVCTGESYKSVVKLTFAKGASLTDPARLFNASLEGNARRAIDIHEGEDVDASAFKALVRQAVALNSSGKSKPAKKAKSD